MTARPAERSAGDGATAPRPSRGRRTAFRVITIIMAVGGLGFGLFTWASNLLESQRIHLFHNVVVGSLLVVLSAPAAIAAARNPEGSIRALMHLAAVGIAGVATMVLALTLDPFTLPFVVLVGVLWMLRVATGPAFPPGRISPIMLLLVAAATIPLVAYAVGQAELQRIDDTSEHAEFFHWVETSFYAVAALLLGLLAALRPAAYGLSARTGGVAVAVLGGASLVFPDRASALGAPWAWAAFAGAIVFVAVAEWERRRVPAPETACPRF
jgi:hypothetical protein